MLTCPEPLVLTLFWNIWWIAAEFSKPFWGISQKKETKEESKKKKKSCNFTWVFPVVQSNSAQILSLYVSSKELIIEWVYNS